MIPTAWPSSVFAFGISVPEKSWQMIVSRDQDGKGHKERALREPGLVNRGGSASYTGQGSAGWEKRRRLVWKAPRRLTQGTGECCGVTGKFPQRVEAELCEEFKKTELRSLSMGR